MLCTTGKRRTDRNDNFLSAAKCATDSNFRIHVSICRHYAASPRWSWGPLSSFENFRASTSTMRWHCSHSRKCCVSVSVSCIARCRDISKRTSAWRCSSLPAMVLPKYGSIHTRGPDNTAFFNGLSWYGIAALTNPELRTTGSDYGFAGDKSLESRCSERLF
jgi:hypothetical protein